MSGDIIFRMVVAFSLGTLTTTSIYAERDLAAIAAHTVNPVGVKVSLDEMTVATLNGANPTPRAPVKLAGAPEGCLDFDYGFIDRPSHCDRWAPGYGKGKR